MTPEEFNTVVKALVRRLEAAERQITLLEEEVLWLKKDVQVLKIQTGSAEENL